MSSGEAFEHSIAVSAAIQSANNVLAERLRSEFPYLKTEALDQLLRDTDKLVRDCLREQKPVMAASKARMGLLFLPAELRNYIYELALAPGEICVQQVEMPADVRVTIPPPAFGVLMPHGALGQRTGTQLQKLQYGDVIRSKVVSPAITRVSRQLRQEALPVYYGQSEFVAYVDSAMLPQHTTRTTKDLESWLKMVGPHGVGMIKKLILKMPLPTNKCITKICGCDGRGWHPTNSFDVFNLLGLGRGGLKATAVEVMFGRTIDGVFWKYTTSTREQYMNLEWTSLPKQDEAANEGTKVDDDFFLDSDDGFDDDEELDEDSLFVPYGLQRR